MQSIFYVELVLLMILKFFYHYNAKVAWFKRLVIDRKTLQEWFFDYCDVHQHSRLTGDRLVYDKSQYTKLQENLKVAGTGT